MPGIILLIILFTVFVIVGFLLGFLSAFAKIFRNAYERKPLLENGNHVYKVVKINDMKSWDALGICMQNEEDE